MLDVTNGTIRRRTRLGVLRPAFVLPNGTRVFDLDHAVVEQVPAARHREPRRRQAATETGDDAADGSAA